MHCILSSLGGDCKEVSFSNMICPKELKAIEVSNREVGQMSCDQEKLSQPEDL